MSKPSKKIDPIPGKRVREIRGDMSQEDFAELIGLESAVSVSRIENGKANLSQKRAEIICKKFPLVRLSWLLNLDDIKTTTEFVDNKVSEFTSQIDFVQSAFERGLKNGGYTFVMCPNTNDPKSRNTGLLGNVNMYVVTDKEGHETTITRYDYSDFQMMFGSLLNAAIESTVAMANSHVFFEEVDEYWKRVFKAGGWSDGND